MKSVDIMKTFIIIVIYCSCVRCYICRVDKPLRVHRSIKTESEKAVESSLNLIISAAINDSTSSLGTNLISKEVCRTLVRDVDSNSTAHIEFNVGSTLYGSKDENGCKAIICERYDPKTDVMEMSINTCDVVNPKDSHKREGNPSKEYPHCCDPVEQI